MLQELPVVLDGIRLVGSNDQHSECVAIVQLKTAQVICKYMIYDLPGHFSAVSLHSSLMKCVVA